MKVLITEYEQLRRRERELIEEINAVDVRLIEIEDQLPDDYKYPGDPTADEPQLFDS
jgi:hypothetical protein